MDSRIEVYYHIFHPRNDANNFKVYIERFGDAIHLCTLAETNELVSAHMEVEHMVELGELLMALGKLWAGTVDVGG